MRITGLLLTIAILGAGYFVYQRPEIQELFKTSAKKEDPLAFLEKLPEINPKPRPAKPIKRKPRAHAPERATAEAGELEPTPEYQNQVPNDQLRRVFMQILAAKKLAAGISLAVTDDMVSLAGEVATTEQRKQILDIVDRGREARRIDGQHLKARD